MPVRWIIQEDYLAFTLIGDHSTEELKDASAAALASAEFKPGLPILIDARSALGYPSQYEMQKRFRWMASLPKSGTSRRCAIVAAEARKKMARERAVKARALGMRIGVFTDLEKALSWLKAKSP
jgi:hypothetical protein